MPSYYNPNNLFPATYQMPQMYPNMPVYQQQTTPAPTQSMEWVEGEVGAKAFQRPSWLAPNQAIPLWDNSDTVIYLKSWNQMGMPNPMQVLRYELPKQQATLPEPQQSESSSPKIEEYVTRQDFEDLQKKLARMENLLESRSSQSNQNGRGPVVKNNG